MSTKKSSSIPVSRARPKKLKDLPQESTKNNIFPNRNHVRTHSNEFHNPESYMGVIGLGQTQVKRGDRKEFKLLDLKHSVRIRHGSQTHAKRHSNGKHFNGPQVPLRKSPAASNNSLGKTLYPSVMLNPQCNTLGPGTAIGFAGEDQWCFLGGSHIPQFANTSEQSGLLVNRSLPRSVAVGSTSLFDGLAAKSSWSWFAEDFLGARSYQDPQEPWSSYPYLEPSFPEMKYSR